MPLILRFNPALNRISHDVLLYSVPEYMAFCPSCFRFTDRQMLSPEWMRCPGFTATGTQCKVLLAGYMVGNKAYQMRLSTIEQAIHCPAT